MRFQFRKIRSFFFALLLLSAGFLVFSQELEPEILFGSALSDSVRKSLVENNFTPVRQKLSETGQDNFAYNLILDFPAAADPAGDGDEAEGGAGDSCRDEVVFCFMQEDFAGGRAEILDFLSFLRDLRRDWTATVLFSALDKPEMDGADFVKGTLVFAESVDDADSVCAVALNFDRGRGNSVFTGSESHTTPLWLTERMTDAFFDTRTSFSFEDVLSAVYRLGIIGGQERLSFFFMSDIPAIELNLSEPSFLSVIKSFARDYTPLGTEEWDMHYVYIDRTNMLSAVFMSERVIIIICLSVGILTILILCVFSFTGSNGERHKYEFIKSIYLIPITLGISFFSLALGQNVVFLVSSHFPLNPVVQFGVKIIFSLSFISILFAVQEILRLSAATFVYGYLLSVVSVFNIFLFATRDLTLFVIFALEYIIIYVSRLARRLPGLIIFFILMILPFAPYGYIIIRNAEETELARAVFCTAGGNLLLAFAMFPFQIMWLRILMLRSVRAGGKGYTMRRIILNDLVTTAAVLLAVSALIFFVSHFVYRTEKRQSQRVEVRVTAEERLTLSAHLSKDSFSGMDTNHIRIRSSLPALRYEVVLRGIDTPHPVYDSIYSYTIESDEDGGEIYKFIVPDYPPQEITIDYACDVGARAEIAVTAYYKGDGPYSFRTEKRVLSVE